jgi:hypothetical protein
MGRFGYGDNMYKAVNWYPIASVYDENGWNLDRYYAIGDPFYSDAANYRVQIQAPADYLIAATGDIKREKRAKITVIWEFDAPAVRDFAWLAGNQFQTASKKVGKTTITSYYFTEQAGKQALDYAAESLASLMKYLVNTPIPIQCCGIRFLYRRYGISKPYNAGSQFISEKRENIWNW